MACNQRWINKNYINPLDNLINEKSTLYQSNNNYGARTNNNVYEVGTNNNCCNNKVGTFIGVVIICIVIYFIAKLNE